MTEKDALNQARLLPGASTPSPLFNAGYDVNAGAPTVVGNGVILQTTGPTDAMTQTAFGASIPVNNDLVSLARNPAAAQTQPNDVTGALSHLNPDQAAMLLASLPKADVQRFMSALPVQDQQQLSTALSGPNVTEPMVAKALAGLPQADVLGAFSQVPMADLRTGLQGLSAPQKPGQDGHTATTDKTATGGTAPTDNTSDDNGWVKYAAGALLVGGGGALAWNKLKKSAAKPLAGAGDRLAKGAVPQAAEVTKPVVETFATPKAFTEGPFAGGTLTELSTAKNGTLIGKNPEGIFGAESKAFTEGPFAGAKLTELTRAPNGVLIGKNADGIFAADAKAVTEGAFKGAKLTELTVTPRGVMMGANAEGLFGAGTATELQVFPHPIVYPEGPFAGGSFTQVSFKGGETFGTETLGAETIGENAAGVFNNFRGTASGTTITKLTLRPNGIISENPAGLEGVGTRTLAARYEQPFAVEGGAFDGMKLTHLSAVPVEDGKHLVTVLNRSGLIAEGTDISKAATIGSEELQALLKGTTGTAEAFAAKAAARLAAEKVGAVVLEDGAAKVVAEVIEGVGTAAKL